MRTYLIGALIAAGATVSLVSQLAGVSTSENKSAQVDAVIGAAAQGPAPGASAPVVRDGQVQPVQEPKTVKLDPNVYEAYVGQYRLAGPEAILSVCGDTLTLTREGGRLFVEGKQGKAEMVPESEVTFRVPVCNGTVTFVKDNTGGVSQAIVNLIGLVELTATRVK